MFELLQLSESLEKKEDRLKELSLVDLEIGILEEQLSEFKSKRHKIIDEDSDYSKYKDRLRLSYGVDYHNYCHLLRLFSNMNTENEAEYKKFYEFFKLEDKQLPKEENAKRNIVESSSKDIWENALKLMKDELTDITYKTWIKSMEVVFIDDEQIILKCENNFSLGIIESRYETLILNAVKKLTNHQYSIKYTV